MSGDTGVELLSAAELRIAFDRQFAEVASLPDQNRETLIMIQAGGEPLVVRTRDIAGLVRHGRIVAIPSQAPEVLGIANIRGALMPVYDLAAVLGLATRTETRWAIIIGRGAPIALAFEQFEGQLEITRASLFSDDGAAPRPNLHQLARVGSSIRALIDVAGIAAAIRRSGDSEPRP